MKQNLIFLLFLLPLTFGFFSPFERTCDCEEISNLQKTGQTINTISFEWEGSQQANQYRLHYIREEDQYTSSYFYTTNEYFTFSNLTEGHYTFIFATVCSPDNCLTAGVPFNHYSDLAD